MGTLRRYREYLDKRGVEWTVLYALRPVLRQPNWIDLRLLTLETRRLILGPDTVSAQYQTRESNRERYNQYDWSDGGEQWGNGEEWKAAVVANVMDRYIPRGKTVLEIGPGSGRWTEYLVPRAQRLILVDVSETALEICRSRFGDASHVEYCLVRDKGLDFIAPCSIDAVWSYGTFQVLNTHDIQQYVSEIERILKPGGVAVIHHKGRKMEEPDAPPQLTQFLADSFFAYLVQENRMQVVARNTQDIWKKGEIITVITKPADR